MYNTPNPRFNTLLLYRLSSVGDNTYFYVDLPVSTVAMACSDVLGLPDVLGFKTLNVEEYFEHVSDPADIPFNDAVSVCTVVEVWFGRSADFYTFMCEMARIFARHAEIDDDRRVSLRRYPYDMQSMSLRDIDLKHMSDELVDEEFDKIKRVYKLFT